MNTKDIGTLGESVGITELLRHGIIVSRPLGDNSQYDLILDINSNLLRCQVKTKTTADTDSVEFKVHTTNSSGDRVKYTQVDCYLLVDLVNDRVFLLDHCDKRLTIRIRYDIPNTNNKKQLNLAEDFTIARFIETLP